MDFLLEHWREFWAFITVPENAGAITLIFVILGIFWATLTKPWTWFKKSKEQLVPPPVNIPDPTDQGIVTLTLQNYEDRIAKKTAEAEERLKTAHDEEKALLEQKIKELRKRAANPEQALQEALATIAKLEDALTREGNSIGGDRMAEARQALEAGDFSIADALFAEIEDQEILAVERTARAAFARGNIAEQDIRWADAAQHFARAARLHPNYEHLYSAREFTWRSGDYDKAILLGKDLLQTAKTEYGETHEKYAAALNAHALSLDAAGKYDLAEPLFKQALEICKQTLGQTHPDYATHLNNLAELFRVTGQYELAEPLFKQALEIGKQTIGEMHPSYATRLNNLALLYKTTEKYEQAEPLFKQTLEIDKQTVGQTHPDYATSLNNLAALYMATGKYDQAEPLYKQALKIDKQTIGEAHPEYAIDLNNLAELYKVMRKYELAEPLFKQAIQVLETTLGPVHPNTIGCKANYENFLKTWKK